MPRFNLRSVAFGATVSVLSIGVLASTASAANTEPIYGSGSSLQKVLQQTVTGPAFGAVTYTSTSSGGGLNEFGNNTGAFAPTNDGTANALGRLDDFVGTDDAPSTAQIAAAKVAAGSGTADEVTVPVAQAPVAILLSLPAGVTISNTTVSLPQALLEQVYHHAIPASGTHPANSWGALLAAAGSTITAGAATADSTAVTLQVRVGDSGTTRALKGFLGQVNSGSGWAHEGSDVWSNTSGTTTNGGANTGGGALVTSTLSNPGSVGYANLADSTGSFSATVGTTATGGTHQIVRAKLNGTDASSDPANAATEPGNCSTSTWTGTIPASGSQATWEGAYASSATASGYRLCAPTFDLGWDDYSAVTGSGATPYTQVRATATGDYLRYVVSAAGQATVNDNGYNALPTAIRTRALALAAQLAW